MIQRDHGKFLKESFFDFSTKNLISLSKLSDNYYHNLDQSSSFEKKKEQDWGSNCRPLAPCKISRPTYPLDHDARLLSVKLNQTIKCCNNKRVRLIVSDLRDKKLISMFEI